MNPNIVIPSGIEFDFTNMFGEARLQPEIVEEAINNIGVEADEAVKLIRSTGIAKAHLSKDGRPEHVYFPRMGYIQEGNPNTPASIAKLKEYSQYIQDFDIVLFLGIGGSFLGNRVLFDALGDKSWNKDSQRRKKAPRIYFAGNNVDASASSSLLGEFIRLAKMFAHRTFKIMLVPISKSGTTLETMSAFLYFYDNLVKVENVQLEVTVITDLKAPLAKAPLLQVAEKLNSWKFDIKEGIGGRFSVMTDLGLLTLTAMGGDVERYLQGARDFDEYIQEIPVGENPALMNALLKYLAYKEGRDIEIFMPYAFCLKSLGEWYVQLLAESLGKRFDRDGNVVNYGRTPIVAVGTTDMHAQTQQHQDGRLNKVVQFIEINNLNTTAEIHNPFPEIEYFNKYEGKTMNEYLKLALSANQAALTSDNRYNAKFTLPKMDEYYLGQFMYFLMLSIAYEGELANVDAYDQPGVEVYKRFMKARL